MEKTNIKFIIQTIALFLLALPSAFGAIRDYQIPTDNSTCSSYLFYDDFNRSDNTNLGTACTGHSYTETFGASAQIKDNKLYFSSGGNDGVCTNIALNSSTTTGNYTIEEVYTHLPSDTIASQFRIFSDVACGTEIIMFDDNAAAGGLFLRDSLGTDTAVSPAISWATLPDAVLVARLQVIIGAGTANLTIFNITSTGTLKQLGSTGAKAMTSLNIRSFELFEGGGALRNVSQLRIYNGTVAPTAPPPPSDTTAPVIQSTAINNTTPKVNEVVQVSVNASDETAIYNVMVAHNLTGTFVNQTPSKADSGATSMNHSINLTNTLVRGNVVGFIFTANDTSANTKQSAIITYTVTNTPPPAPTIIQPIANTRYNKIPFGLNISFGTEADGDSITEVKWYINRTLNQTTTGNTTFNASDGRYNLTVSIYDGFNYGSNSTPILFDIDTQIPILTCIGLVNNTFTNANISINCDLDDSDPYNFSIRVWSGSNEFHVFTNNTAEANNPTKLILQKIINATLDGNYTIEINGSDSVTFSPKIDDTLSNEKKTESMMVFNDTKAGVSNTMLFKYEDKNEAEGTIPPDFKSFSAYNEKGTRIIHGGNFTVSKNGDIPAFDITTQGTNIDIVNSTYKLHGHLVFAPYGMDFDGYVKVNGIKVDYVAIIKRLDSVRVKIQIVPKTTLLAGDYVEMYFDSIFGLNVFDLYYNIVYDFTPPTAYWFNISSLANNSFVNAKIFNVTINASDRYSDTALLFVNDKKNASVRLYTNLTLNISNVVIGNDGNYTFKVQVNDTASNMINFTSSYNIVIDSIAPIDSNPLNRTVIGNSTAILDSTDVNLTVFIGDIYLSALNISHNASGPWINHSITIASNQTYHLTISQNNLTEGQVVGWKYDAYDLAGNHLDPIYTFKVGSSASEESGGGGGGGGGSSLQEELYEQCITYINQWQTCYYKDSAKNLCIKGCPNGYSCSGVTCNFMNQTITMKTNEQTLSRWQTLKNWFLGLFSANAPLTLMTPENPLNSPVISPEPNLEGVITKTTTQIQNNPEIAIAIVLGVLLAVAIYFFGFMFLFTNPLILGIMAVILFIAYLIINYGVFK